MKKEKSCVENVAEIPEMKGWEEHLKEADPAPQISNCL